jgi:hypothetical protein
MRLPLLLALCLLAVSAFAHFGPSLRLQGSVAVMHPRQASAACTVMLC